MKRKRSYKYLPILLVLLLIVGFVSLKKGIFTISDNPASVFFVESINAHELKKRYKNGEKLQILVVPGHDNESKGTIFNGLVEANLTVDVGEKLTAMLRENPRFNVTLSRNSLGYDPAILQFFKDAEPRIKEFISNQKMAMKTFVGSGKVTKGKGGVYHNVAASDVSFKLYGINKWANENKIDIVIHLHFNDYPGRKKGREGKYSGFSIYVPESQYSNASASKEVANSIFKELSAFYPSSDLKAENKGVIADQELIAIGANNTLDGVGVLVEYGYIYEPQFQDAEVRDKMMKELAHRTVLGIEKFFGEEKLVRGTGALILSEDLSLDLDIGDKYSEDVLSLQHALTIEGVYPPSGYSKNDCPISGNFGKCTRLSVIEFQRKYNIKETGVVGEMTRAKLNSIY